MTDEQWGKLQAVIKGHRVDPLPVAFIIDSPWLPEWAGVSIMDYFSSDQKWLDANLKAVRQFPDIIFLPGFWAEFGMCTEPSAFGAKCKWRQNELPFAEKILTDVKEVDALEKPDPKTDGLLPFIINRLKNCQPDIEQAGHKIRFAVSRGPLNIASFLAGSTELLIAMHEAPEHTHKLLTLITDFTIDWLKHQKETFPSIEGTFILDDIVGFCGEELFKQFALPYLKQIFDSLDVKVKFFHNDAAGLVCAPYLSQIGVNLFNFSFQHTLQEMKDLTKNKVTLLGNIPGRDILAAGTPQQVRDSVNTAINSLKDKTQIILSAGGGMPPAVPTKNIEAFLNATA